jgi:hypothetical protein
MNKLALSHAGQDGQSDVIPAATEDHENRIA